MTGTFLRRRVAAASSGHIEQVLAQIPLIPPWTVDEFCAWVEERYDREIKLSPWQTEAPEAGDLLAVMSAGAYGYVMASNYNSRPRVAEVLVKGSEVHLIRARETYEDLVRGESIPTFLT